MSDARLLIGWLVLLHLVAEFVLQGDPPDDDRRRGRPGIARLAVHVLVVALCFGPVVAAFGGPGAAVAGLAVLAHLVLDGSAFGGARAGGARAGSSSGAVRSPDGGELSLGPAWSIRPAAAFLLVQAVHVAVLVTGWRIFLAGAAPTSLVNDLASNVAGSFAPADFHRTVMVGVVALAALVVDVWAAGRFVAILLRPWGYSADDALSREADARPATDHGPSARRWRIAVGPFAGSIVAEPADPSPGLGRAAAGAGPAAPGAAAASPTAAAAPVPRTNVGRAIGIFERVLITMLVLARAEAAVALVVGVKTVARYRQLDDRSFAEYYLLGTLASVSIGIGAGLLARVTLA